ncbi:MAG TPA: helix-turn-helix domain-containing protein, partial [Myxococcota bacterium]
FRLIAATNRDLEKEVEAGRFRRDLFYRLCVCPVSLPALRARPSDVEETFRHMWIQRGETRTIDDAVMAKLRAYAWPGNVRELENLVERLSICSLGDTIVLGDLPAHVIGAPAPVLAAPVHASHAEVRQALIAPKQAEKGQVLAPMSIADLLRDIEYSYIDAALAQTDNNRQAAATLLGLQRTTLVEKLRRRDRLSGEGAPVVESTEVGAMAAGSAA